MSRIYAVSGSARRPVRRRPGRAGEDGI